MRSYATVMRAHKVKKPRKTVAASPATRLGIVVFFVFMVCLVSAPAQAGGELSGKKILVVNSYGADSNAEIEIKDGFEPVLKGAEIRYFHMDTKNNPDKGPERAREAYELYKTFKPDLVLSTNDNAQSMFVLPYLQDKVATPIVFCGVNDDASKYGYPNSHITGVIEKKHYREGVSFAKLIVPDIKTIAVIFKDNPSNQTNNAQIKREQSSYPVEIVSFNAVESTTELGVLLDDLKKTVDALLVLNLAGIKASDGTMLTTAEGMNLVAKLWPKPTIGGSKQNIPAGILCGVAKLNEEQGQLAAEMVKQILNGKPIREIPVTENHNGRRMINVTTAVKLGIDLKPMVLVGTTLVQ